MTSAVKYLPTYLPYYLSTCIVGNADEQRCFYNLDKNLNLETRELWLKNRKSIMKFSVCSLYLRMYYLLGNYITTKIFVLKPNWF